ncbi:MAG: hypothetical protein LBH79_09735, partial [Nitrososphaerota archaeon]|nr:hypothetical protein [Nitrososphaerota archaeon]
VVELIAIVLTFKHKDNKDESVAYTVQYYLQGTKTPVAAAKTSGFGTIGGSITEYAPTIAGYSAAGNNDTLTLTLQKDPTKNEMTFYYTPNTDKDKTRQQTRSDN